MREHFGFTDAHVEVPYGMMSVRSGCGLDTERARSRPRMRRWRSARRTWSGTGPGWPKIAARDFQARRINARAERQISGLDVTTDEAGAVTDHSLSARHERFPALGFTSIQRGRQSVSARAGLHRDFICATCRVLVG